MREVFKTEIKNFVDKKNSSPAWDVVSLLRNHHVTKLSQVRWGQG